LTFSLVFSFFENPNSYGNILVLFAPIMLTMAFYSPKVWQRFGFGAVFFLCCIALMMTYARGGWLALAFAIFILMVILCPRWIPLIIALGFLAVPFLPDSIIARFLTIFSGSDSSIYTRGYIYSAMVRIIGQNPVFGAGLGAAVLKYAIEVAGVYKASAVFVHAHDIYMQIWGESGIFALISFLIAIYLPLRSGVRSIKKHPSSMLKGILAGCISGLSGSLFFGLTDYAWSYPRVMVMFWFVFAILCAAVKLSKSQNLNKEAGIVHE
jgi:putative inorganic carbon (HCO3(-)) transporter